MAERSETLQIQEKVEAAFESVREFVRDAISASFEGPLFSDSLSDEAELFHLHNYIHDAAAYLDIVASGDQLFAILHEGRNTSPLEIWETQRNNPAVYLIAQLLDEPLDVPGARTWQLQARDPELLEQIRFVHYPGRPLIPLLSRARTLGQGHQEIRYFMGDDATGTFYAFSTEDDGRSLRVQPSFDRLSIESGLRAFSNDHATRSVRNWGVSCRQLPGPDRIQP